MSALEVFHFDGAEVRVVVIDGDPWFVARDVATRLGYADATSAIKQHCKGVAKHHPLQTAGGLQSARVIAEPDLLRLIVNSRLASAERFERLVFEEILPTIRRTGSYGLTIPGTYAEALEAAAAQARRAEALEAKAAEDAPKVHFADAVAASESTILVGDLAKILKGNGYDTGANRLFAQLREEGYLIRRAGADYNMPTQRSMELGLFEIRERTRQEPGKSVVVMKTTRVTGKGQQYFIDRYAPKVAAA